MDRREALRGATVLAAGAVASACTARGTPAATTATPGPSTAGTAPAPPAATVTWPAEISHGPRDRPRVALTFHGQGDPVVVGRLLDGLAAGGAHVTVLAVGSWLAARPTLAHRVLAAGHELGNHTQNHADIKRMPPARAHAEIAGCARVLYAQTGSIGRWFRPSQTRSATATIRRQAALVGYPTCLSYDVDSLDYTDPGAGAIVRTTLATVRNGSIVSLHFGHPGTVGAIGPLLRGLRDRGLEPVTVSELTA